MLPVWPQNFDAGIKHDLLRSSSCYGSFLVGYAAVLVSGYFLGLGRSRCCALTAIACIALYYYNGVMHSAGGPALRILFGLTNAYGVFKAFEILLVALTRTVPRRVDTSNPGRKESNLYNIQYAFNTLCDLRGIGWEWGGPTGQSRILGSTWPVFLYHFCMLDLVGGTLYYMASIQPKAIFTENPVSFQIAATVVVGYGLTSAFSCGYLLFRAVGIFLFRQKSSQWPALLDSPSDSITVRELWSTRWHQLCRRMLLYPTRRLVDCTVSRTLPRYWQRMLIFFMVFFMSGMLHHLGMWFAFGVSDWRVFCMFAYQPFLILFQENMLRNAPKLVNRAFTILCLLFSAGPFGVVGFAYDRGVFLDPLFTISQSLKIIAHYTS